MASALTLLCGCVGDLDVMPLDSNVMTAQDAYASAEGILKLLRRFILYGPYLDKMMQVLLIWKEWMRVILCYFAVGGPFRRIVRMRQSVLGRIAGYRRLMA